MRYAVRSLLRRPALSLVALVTLALGIGAVAEMINSTVLTLVVIPAIYSLWKEREVRSPVSAAPAPELL